MYSARYSNSWALIVGIDRYRNAPTLQHAANDATEVANVLSTSFGFDNSRTTILTNEMATLATIRTSIAKLCCETINDDRVFVFYAGHGHTIRGNRRDAGYLVPVDGDFDNLATLLSWQELADSADRIQAKHILFVMDACYSGLFCHRSVRPGASRLVVDMLTRYSRQYITAGKADETVSDGNGPRRGHSIFTGHFLNALAGGVQSSEGVLSANAVIAHVYDKVATDPLSTQTPHFGWLEGDGDFFFKAPAFDQLDSQTQTNPLLVQVSAELTEQEGSVDLTSQVELAKLYLSEPKYRIKFSDLTSQEIRRVQSKLSTDNFPVAIPQLTNEAIAERITNYESAMQEFFPFVSLVGRWANEMHQTEIEQIGFGLGEMPVQGGNGALLSLRYFPSVLISYALGISALFSNNFGTLHSLFKTQVRSPNQNKRESLIVVSTEAMLHLDQNDIFKRLPGHERNYFPRSEYLFKRLQPVIEDSLFLGSRFEELFDRYEMIQSLCYLDMDNHDWAPGGRFFWKHTHRSQAASPLEKLVTEANSYADGWPLLRAGFFGGKLSRFRELVDREKAHIGKCSLH